jgi:WD40 repeat protein
MGNEAPTPRQRFAQRFRELLKLSGLPQERVAAQANRKRPPGAMWHIKPQRISAWQRGTNVPATDRDLKVVLKVLIDHCQGRKPPVERTDDLFDLKAWETLWSQALASSPDPSPKDTERWAREGPYLGLAAYKQEQADLFFGRGVLVSKLLESVADRLEHPGLLVVSGASGAGKSSLLHAGLLPALAAEELGEEVARWPVQVMTPTAAPMDELARVLASLSHDHPLTFRARLEEHPEQAVRDVVTARAEARTHRLVLIVDQFEDVLSPLPMDEIAAAQARKERLAFVEALHAMATRPCGPGDAPAALVVIAVRGDFLESPVTYDRLQDSIQRRGLFLVGPMDQEQLRLAIEGPASQAGLKPESGLVEVILGELLQGSSAAGPGSLPLLSEAMRATWQRRDGDRLTIRGYERSGGVRKAIQNSAETVLDDLTQEQRAVARQMFHRMVKITPGGPVVSRPMPYRPSASPTDLDVVVRKFTEQRLLTATDGAVEITHDALLRDWKTLRDWLADDPVSRALHSRLLDDADTWIRHGEDPSYLYRDRHLSAVLAVETQWRADLDRYPLAAEPRAFLDASRQASTRTARRRRRRLALLSGLLVIAVSAAAVATSQWRVAEEERSRAETQRRNADTSARIALSRHLVARSEIVSDPVARLQLGIAAAHLNPGAETRANLLVHMAKAGFTATLTPDPSPHDVITGLALSAEGSLLATAVMTSLTEGAVLLWDVSDRDRPRRVSRLAGPDGRVSSVAFSGDALVAVGSSGGSVELWNVSDLSDPDMVANLVGHTGFVNDLEFARDGRTLASASADKTVKLWDVRNQASPRAVSTLPGHPAQVGAVSFSPNGTLLATADVDGNALVWDIADLAEPHDVVSTIGHPGVNDVAFSPDGRTLATAEEGRTVHLLDIDDPRKPRTTATLTGHKDSVVGVAFSPDGRTLATGSADRTTRIWNLSAVDGPAPLTTLEGHGLMTLRPAYWPDGRFLATASFDGTARLWAVADPKHLTTTALLPTERYDSKATAIAFSPDGATLATNQRDKVQLWDVTNRAAPRSITFLPGRSGIVTDVLFAPKGDILAATTFDGEILLWDVKDTRHPVPLAKRTGHTALVNDAAFSSDGKLLATAGFDHKAKVWDVSDAAHPRLRATLTDHTAEVSAVAFAPHGRTLATGGHDNRINLWDVTDLPAPPKLRHSVATGYVAPIAIAFSPDGHLMAAANGSAAQVWNAMRPDAERSVTVFGHDQVILSVAISPDGQLLATGSQDRKMALIYMWPQRDGVPRISALPNPTAHSGTVGMVVFSPDGQTLASIDANGEVKLTALTQILKLTTSGLDTLITRACILAGSALNVPDWHAYAQGLPYRQTCPS